MESFILPLLLLLLALPLILGARRQKKAMRDQQALHSSLSTGDTVTTTSGLRATVVEVRDETLDLELAPGVVTTWLKAAVREKVADATTTASDEEYESDDEDVTDTDHAEASYDGTSPNGTAQVAPSIEEASRKDRN